MEQPIIVCGLGRVGGRVLEYLQATGLPVVVIDDRCAPDDPRLGSARLVPGDCRRAENLLAAGLADARGVLILTSDDLVNISTALLIRSLHPTVRIVMRMFNQNLISRLGKAVSNVFALSTSTLTAPVLALIALTGQALGMFRLEGTADGRRQVAEVTIEAASPLRGRTVAEAAGLHDAVVVAHFPAGGVPRFLGEVDAGDRLQPGDRIVVCGPPHRLAPLLDPLEGDTAPHLRWAGLLRRWGRTAWRALGEVDLLVKLCTGVLLGVVLASTLLFHFAMDRQGVADALFRTISLIATGADMHEEEYHHPGLKVFVSALRLFGAALTAAFTAIVTNYLLRARLRGALEVRRIPDGGHVVVCGLGNVGFRVVEELVAADERVVAIELVGDSRFVATARRLGVAVITGDATVREVLRQAHAAAARAVVAATNHDLVNLEVALLVRELNPHQRVVVRMHDPNLAQTLREAADVRLALSIPALAAPAFVAALFGDRVPSMFLVGGRLLGVVDVLVQEGDALAGQSLKALATDRGLLPVAVVGADGKVRMGDALRLAAGDRLAAIAALPELERLLRREPVPRGHSVEVTGFPPEARSRLAELLRTGQGMPAEEAERALDHLPVCVATDLTRGQAEELLAVLSWGQVSGQVRPPGKCPLTAED